jgi:phosphatidylglycerophosphatase B
MLFFGWLAEEMIEGDTVHFDEAVRMGIHGFASPPLTRVMEMFSFLGSVGFLLTMTVLIILLFLYFRRRHAAALLAIGMAGGALLEVVLKVAFHRARPAVFFGAAPASYSFPSGHAMASLCFYGVIAVLLSARMTGGAARFSIWIAAILLVGLIGLSRVYLGVHYPSDVLAGYSAGLVWVGTMGMACKLWERDLCARPESSGSASNLP